MDPSGGAGLLADIKTFSALGAYGCGVVAALTAQNTQAVTGIHTPSTDFLRLQLDTLLADVAIDAVKLGMLAANLPESGVLLARRAPETVKEMYRAAERLRELLPLSSERWVLLKGGHLPGDEVVDLLFDGDRMIEMPAPRLDTKNTHGTGCTLSSAIAALLPQYVGAQLPTIRPVEAAVRHAREYLLKAIAAADTLQVGQV